MKEEKIFFKDDNVKITDLRVTCNHVTVPIKKISHVRTDLRVNSMVIAVTCFLLSFVLFYWHEIDLCMIGGMILAIVNFIWICNIFRTYVELYATVDGKNVRLLEINMNRREYVYKIADSIVQALIEDKKLENEKEELDRELPRLSLSETLKLRMILEEQEENKISKFKDDVAKSL